MLIKATELSLRLGSVFFLLADWRSDFEVRALVEKKLAWRCEWKMIMRRIFHRCYPL